MKRLKEIMINWILITIIIYVLVLVNTTLIAFTIWDIQPYIDILINDIIFRSIILFSLVISIFIQLLKYDDL